MFSMDVVFKISGREVQLDEFVEALLARSLKAVRSDIEALRARETRLSTAQTETSPPPRAVGVGRAAELLSLSKHTIRKYVAEGKLHSVRAGRRILIPMETLDRILREGLLPRR